MKGNEAAAEQMSTVRELEELWSIVTDAHDLRQLCDCGLPDHAGRWWQHRNDCIYRRVRVLRKRIARP